MSYHFIDEDRMKLRFPIYCKGKFKRFSWSDILVGAKVVAGYEDRMKPEQCTGKRDKDGCLIYEHDIVRCTYKTEHLDGVVVWDNEVSGFSILVNKELYSFEERNKDDTVEVIGNIHENPKLLKESK